MTTRRYLISTRSISVLICICACLLSASGFCYSRVQTVIEGNPVSCIRHKSSLLLKASHFEASPKSVHETALDEVKFGFLALTIAGSVLGNVREARASDPVASKNLLSDEFEVVISGSYLGIGLTELEYRDKKNLRVCVQSVKDNADESVIRVVKPGMILVALNGANVEGQSRSQVIDAIKLAPRPLTLVFRSREMFFQKLNSTSPSSGSDSSASWVVETAISPSEVLKVERVERGKGMCLRSAAIGDVVEVSYQVRLPGQAPAQGQIVDGAESLAAEGSRPSDENMYFVLAPYNSGSSAAQGAGFGGTALPAGWDASIRGMCVGERRVISLPASLAFGKDGLSLKKTMGAAAAEAGTGIRASIPPNTPIVIDVRLLSLNGVA